MENEIKTENELQLAVNAAKKTFLSLNAWMCASFEGSEQQAVEDMTIQAP